MAAATHEATGSMSLPHLEAVTAAGAYHATISDDATPRSSPIMIDTPHSTGTNRPLPLPDFVFPMRAPASLPSPRSAPSSFSRASGRRPMASLDLNGDRSIESGGHSPRAQLPDFTFGNSPLQSPALSPGIAGRPGFHKRGTSEFIGGDGKTSNGGGLMSTSPTKGDNVLPAPNPAAMGGGRRGHAHRRSQAISHNDLTMIMKPDTSAGRGGASAPTSPSTAEHANSQFTASLDTAINTPSEEKESTSASETTPAVKPLNRTRVGFSDVIDIIPRPLSIVSSDSSSTIRQSHSVTGSISSIVSTGTSSPQPKERRGVSSTLQPPKTDTRPSTAEPVKGHDATQGPDAPRRRNSIPLLMEAASNSTTPIPSTPRSLKKWSFFGGEAISGESSPKSRPTSSASSASKDSKTKGKAVETAPLSPDLPTPDVPVRTTERSSSRSSSLTKKPSKKQKKVRTWAGSILGRKSRQRSQKQKLSRRSPTPPLRSYTPMEENRDFAFTHPEPTQEEFSHSTPELHTDIASWKPRPMPQEESTSPIIDLDAALGPFNTPTSFGDDWEASQRSGNIKKRTMHSAGGLSGFTGPGMHYHRRAESAPEFENPRFNLHRLGSSSTMGRSMEDVFEEENEDEDWEDTKTSDKASISKSVEDDEDTAFGIDIKVVDSDGMEADKNMDFEEASFHRGVLRKSSALSSTKSEHSNRSFVEDSILEESDPVEIVDDSIPPRPASGSRSSSSTATPPFRPAAKSLAPVEIQPFSLQPPFTNSASPQSTTQASFPSPRSPFSYDAQRISTAPSSLTDEQGYESLLLGEPGPEVRMSVDDVPSLTSSNSTMTRDGGIPMAQHNPQFRDGQRSSSLSAAAVSRKRSSMASLSRLITSSHGEKSKLSIETRPSTSEGVETTPRPSRGKRLSRMMQFWKPKEN